MRYLLDHLSGLRQHVRRDLETNCVGGLEIDDKIKLSWKLDWQFPWIGTSEDFVDVARRAAVLINEVEPL